MKYLTNISSNISVKLLQLVLGLGSSVIIARALGAEGKGYVAYFLIFFNIIAQYGHFGINSATAYFQKKSEYSQEKVFNVNNSFLIILWFFIIILLGFLKHLGLILADYSVLFLLLGFIYILLNFLMISAQNTYMVNQEFIKKNKYFTLLLLMDFLSYILLWSLNSLDVRSYILVKIITILIYVVLLIKNLKIKLGFYLDKTLLLKEFKYGINIYFATLFIFLTYKLDQILIKHITKDTGNVGVYSIGVVLAELVLVLAVSTNIVFAGKLYNLSWNFQTRKRITTITIKYSFYISLVLCLLGWILTPLIPVLYGQEFKGSIEVMKILLFGLAFVSIGKISISYYTTKGEPKIPFLVAFIVFMVNLLLNLVLIPSHGIKGAALASTIAYFLYGSLYILFFIFKEKIKLKEFIIINRSDISLFKKYISSRKSD